MSLWTLLSLAHGCEDGAVPTNSGAAAQQLRALSADDFSYDNPALDGWEQLRSICADLQNRDAVMECAEDMFALMERLDGVDLGSPGPLVHALESTGAAYEPRLKASVQRKPSPLTVWMVNRILNTDRPNRGSWLDLLLWRRHILWHRRSLRLKPRNFWPTKPVGTTTDETHAIAALRSMSGIRSVGDRSFVRRFPTKASACEQPTVITVHYCAPAQGSDPE
jgi:hypothetical protein